MSYLERANEWCRSEEKRVKQEAEDMKRITPLRMPLERPTEPAGEFK